jgi:hypothetical protein
MIVRIFTNSTKPVRVLYVGIFGDVSMADHRNIRKVRPWMHGDFNLECSHVTEPKHKSARIFTENVTFVSVRLVEGDLNPIFKTPTRPL